MERLTIDHLGPIGHVDVHFGDLTILVGAQASGKSIFLETFKLMKDRHAIISTLERYGLLFKKDEETLLNRYYGQGMAEMWSEETAVSLNQDRYGRGDLLEPAAGKKQESMFYVPAQRILCMPEGRPKNFMEFDASTPYVFRSLGETLRMLVNYGLGNTRRIYPIDNRLKSFVKKSLDSSIFYNSSIETEEDHGRYELKLNTGGISVPYQSWSAGQKEFMPLLLSIYCLSGPPQTIVNKDRYEYVVVEEPEMGLHPKAITSVILQLLELIANGYKVIVSTHSQVFMEFAWAFYSLADSEKRREALCEMFEVRESANLKKMLYDVANKEVRTYFFRHDAGQKVISTDISGLDVLDEDESIAEWGGISRFASRVTDVVSKYISL